MQPGELARGRWRRPGRALRGGDPLRARSSRRRARAHAAATTGDRDRSREHHRSDAEHPRSRAKGRGAPVVLKIAVPIAGSAVVVCVSIAAAVLRDATGRSRRRRLRRCRCCHRGRGPVRAPVPVPAYSAQPGSASSEQAQGSVAAAGRRRAHDKDPARFHRRIVGERRHESIAAWSEILQRVASGAGSCPAAVECVPEGVRPAGRGTGHGYVYGHRLAGLGAAVRRQDAEVWFRWWRALGRCGRGDGCGGGRGAG